MSRFLFSVLALFLAVQSHAAEQRWDFDSQPTNTAPANCFNMLAGDGKPGTWKVISDDVPLPLAPLTPDAQKTMKKNVVAQLAQDTTDEHFPMLVLGNDKYKDFTLKTKFKIVDGLTEQMAGIAFRIQDEKNFYVIRASAFGSNFLFYKVEKGVRGQMMGSKMEITKGVWHDLTLECEGKVFRIKLDGTNALPSDAVEDPTFVAGKIAYWTKSDAVSYFSDTRITYVPKEPFAQRMVKDAMKEYPRLMGIQVYASPRAKETQIIASSDEKEIGTAGGKHEKDVIENGTPYYNKEKEMVSVMMPLRDRNGDVQAAVRIKMHSFPGQTEENAFVRATPIIRAMQDLMVTVTDLNE